MLVNLLIALVPSLLFGATSLLLMRFGGDDRQKAMGLIGGGFLFAMMTIPFNGIDTTPERFLIGMGTGVLLGMGMFYQTAGFQRIGLSRMMPISTGGQLLGMALGGVLLFGEWRGPGALPVGIGALILLIGGIAAISWSDKSEDAIDAEKLDWRGGIIFLVVSTIGLVAYLLIQRSIGMDGLEATVPQAFGYLITGLIITSPKLSPWEGPVDRRFSKRTLLQFIPGLTWGAAVLIMQTSAERVGVAAGFSLSQLGIVISTFGAILWLGEKRTRREMWSTAAGVVLVVAGAALVGVAKALDAAAGVGA